MKYIFDCTDYRPLAEGETYENKYVIVRPEFFKPEYREARYQLFYAVSGFGCDPNKLGGKIFGRFCDEITSIRRENVLGVATQKALDEYEEIYGSLEVFREVKNV